mgnify:CR=1 FL=1
MPNHILQIKNLAKSFDGMESNKQACDEIEKYFIEFLKNEVPSNPLKSEFFLPFLVRDLLSEGKCAVDVLETADKWFGVTYKEDKPDVVKSISALVESGEYPERLWD